MPLLSKSDKAALIQAGLVALGVGLAYYLQDNLEVGSGDKTFPLTFPVRSRRVTSGYGSRRNPVTGKNNDFHKGVDFAAAEGDPVTAPAGGVIIGIDKNSTGGNQLIMRHDNGWHTGYAHLSSYAARMGQRVERGQLIAYVGKTGRVTGPHLHFVVSDPTRQSRNPLHYLPKLLRS